MTDVEFVAPEKGDRDPLVDRARATEILKRRIEGATWQEIADEFQYADKSGPHGLVRRFTQREFREAVDEHREIENDRLDAVQRSIWPLISGPEVDPNVRLRAADTFVRLSARRARLNGLDAPVKVDLSVGVQAELTDALAELREYVEQKATPAVGDVVPGEVMPPDTPDP